MNENLPDSYKTHSKLAVNDLVGSVNKFNVVSDLLVRDQASIKNKLRDCLLKWEFSSKGGATNEDRIKLEKIIEKEKITEGLVELAEPSVREVILLYHQLQTQNDELLKKSLLPLLQKYIGQPI